MSKFGGSYPPGCSGTPYDEDLPCEICGHEAGSCICPECPVCGSVGDPECYEKHGLILSEKQKESKREMEAQWEAEASYEPDLGLDPYDDHITPGCRVYQYKIYDSGEPQAGFRSFSDDIRIIVESGDPGGVLKGEDSFQEFMLKCLKDWYDGASVTLVEG